ncbi:hypothetical protein AUJ68_04240 [Candidatus Woesearchaeota archaeon CG1_02_57_44]|nr:MAG: hypothetical protein AUJ68_04240 [Candidatus Woesearchaeota archaeon CG1_02_57_44]
MKLGKPIKYLAVPPDEVLDRVKKRVVEDSEHKADMLDKLRDSKTLEELKYIHQEGVTKIDPTDLSGSIRGRTQVYNHIDMLIKSSEESIDFMTTPDGFDRKMDAFKRSLKKAMGKGVKVRALISPGKVTETDIVKKIEIRKNVKVNARVVIIDKKHLILFLTNDTETHPSYDTGVWLGADFFGQAMQDFYGMLWQESK